MNDQNYTLKKMMCGSLRWLCKRLCPHMMFNSDMSLEIDRLIVLTEQQQEEIEQLKDEIKHLRRLSDV